MEVDIVLEIPLTPSDPPSNTKRYANKYIKWLVLSAIFILIYIAIGILIGIFWTDLTWEGWVSIYLLITVLLFLIIDLWNAALTFFGAMIILMLLKIITIEEALKGFADPSVGTIAVLFIAAAAIKETGILEQITRKILRVPSNIYIALSIFLPIVVILSAFTNNTPIVLIFITMLQSWSIKTGLPLNQMLMPLSFSSILGGTCTIIGTSTNLVVQGLASRLPIPITLEFFEIAMVGVPLAVVGVVYMVILSKWMLPDITAKRKYIPIASIMYKVPTGSNHIGKTIEAAGLNKISGTRLVRYNSNHLEPRVTRQDNFAIPTSDTTMEKDDLLYYVGVPECIKGISGLNTDSTDITTIAVFECKINPDADIISSDYFSEQYNCRILAVNRDGKMIMVTDIKPDDIVIVESGYVFLHYMRFTYFQSITETLPLKQKAKAHWLKLLHPWIVTVLFITMIVLTITNISSLFASAGVVICVFIAIQLLNWTEAITSINADIIILIASSFSLSVALTKTTVSQRIAGILIGFNSGGVYGQLLGIYLITNLLSAVLSNVAAASIMFPIVIDIANTTGLNIKAALYTLMIASSYAFLTPIGYQTNLMVQDEGGYTWGDFLKFGAPLTIIYLLLTPGLAMGMWKS